MYTENLSLVLQKEYVAYVSRRCSVLELTMTWPHEPCRRQDSPGVYIAWGRVRHGLGRGASLTLSHAHTLLRCLLRGWMCFTSVFYQIQYLCYFFLSFVQVDGAGMLISSQVSSIFVSYTMVVILYFVQYNHYRKCSFKIIQNVSLANICKFYICVIFFLSFLQVDGG